MPWSDIIRGNAPAAEADSSIFNESEMCGACPSLSYQNRVIGFVTCMVVGYFISFMGTAMLISGGVSEFAVLYTLGNVIALCGSAFLIGPKSHCQKMFHEKRRYAAIFYITMLLLVFTLALIGINVFLILVLLVIQCLSAIWYSASYIPYGRTMIVNACCGPCKDSLKDCTGD
mmetsp:Transcript_6439/g.9658  ORF Transcript_6439/g.9658 Transcript_6439/m.9658 type:complete len:173 (+) Transcript_6439:68-586(+)